MPVYEFRCPQGHEFEKFYRTISTAEARAACPTCGEESERMMSATGFAFKGSGFYLTDYGKNAHRDKGTPTPVSPAAGEGGKGEGKNDAGKGEGAKTEGAKAEGAKSDSTGAASSGGSDSAKPAKPAAAEPKPAAPAPKKSAGE